MKYILSIFAASALLMGGAFVACESPTKGRPAPPDPFPNSVGTQWLYLVELPLTGETDTLEVVIVDTITGEAGIKFSIWEKTYRSDGRVDSDYVDISADTVLFANSIRTITLRWFYILHAEEGDGWSNLLRGGVRGFDSTYVLAPEDVNVPAGVFSTATTFSRLYIDATQSNIHDFKTWIVPEVGIVKRRHEVSRLSDPPADTLWSLISTTIPSRRV